MIIIRKAILKECVRTKGRLSKGIRINDKELLEDKLFDVYTCKITKVDLLIKVNINNRDISSQLNIYADNTTN